MRGRTRHVEYQATIGASPQEVFDHLDDPETIGGHMSRGSPMMPGGGMHYVLDAGAGRVVGSLIRMEGRAMGLSLHVEEVISVRRPPTLKVWETVGPQRMIVIQDYRLGFETRWVSEATALRVFIDYTLPEGPVGRLLGLLIAPFYARWCLSQIVDGARRHFDARRAT